MSADNNFFSIAKEIYPGLNDEEINSFLWEYTGFPCFWNIPKDGLTPEECCRNQLMEIKNKCS